MHTSIIFCFFIYIIGYTFADLCILLFSVRFCLLHYHKNKPI